ncbi:MAG: SCO family protein [Rhizobiaceae bacterium]|nr:SCO family protein [Rhizobiaceae bacterium]
MRKLRFFLWGAVFFAAIGSLYLYSMTGTNQQPNTLLSGGKLGDEFTLMRHNGQPISDKDLLGKPHAIFFGFTSCPEVCPSTLYEITTWLDELGEDADRIGVYFITVDPERDTQEILAEYMESFDSRIIGITGDKAKVEQTLRSYKVHFERVELDDGDYTMDHTATIYLLNSEGTFVRSIAYGENSQTAVAKLKLMLN